MEGKQIPNTSQQIKPITNQKKLYCCTTNPPKQMRIYILFSLETNRLALENRPIPGPCPAIFRGILLDGLGLPNTQVKHPYRYAIDTLSTFRVFLLKKSSRRLHWQGRNFGGSAWLVVWVIDCCVWHLSKLILKAFNLVTCFNQICDVVGT